MGIGFFLTVIGMMADLISVNRNLLEKIDWRVQKIEEIHHQKDIKTDWKG